MPKKSYHIWSPPGYNYDVQSRSGYNLGADIDELRVVSIEVNEAPRFKRFRARAKGRGERRIKRNSHITIRVGDEK